MSADPVTSTAPHNTPGNSKDNAPCSLTGPDPLHLPTKCLKSVGRFEAKNRKPSTETHFNTKLGKVGEMRIDEDGVLVLSSALPSLDGTRLRLLQERQRFGEPLGTLEVKASSRKFCFEARPLSEMLLLVCCKRGLADALAKTSPRTGKTAKRISVLYSLCPALKFPEPTVL